jgi:hypothetical protein
MEPRASKSDKLWIPELDEMSKSLAAKLVVNRVSISQSRIRAKIDIYITGDVDETGPKVKEIYELLVKS